ncbi:MAG: hypothetical protein JNL09_04705 [Anaerolineales bacterium]|nr:hypothetical protein [Anaerolineales bacterium]
MQHTSKQKLIQQWSQILAINVIAITIVGSILIPIIWIASLLRSQSRWFVDSSEIIFYLACGFPMVGVIANFLIVLGRLQLSMTAMLNKLVVASFFVNPINLLLWFAFALYAGSLD